MQYFDSNATVPLLPEALAAYTQESQAHWAHPGSPYRAAARAHQALEAAKANLLKLASAPEESTCIIGPSASQLAHLLLEILAAKNPGAHLLVHPTSHNCVLRAAQVHFPARTHSLPTNAQGQLHIEKSTALIQQLRAHNKTIAALCTLTANNETGVLEDTQATAHLAAQQGTPLLTDAVQTAGKLPAETEHPAPLHAHFASAHKFGGPKNTGYLMLSPALANTLLEDINITNWLGTPCIPSAAAMAAALQNTTNTLQNTTLTQRATWRDAFEADLLTSIPGSQIICAKATRLWNTSLLTLPSQPNTRWVLQLEKRGFYIGTGAACAGITGTTSHVLAHLNISPEAAQRTVRISANPHTTHTNWQALANAFKETWASFEAEA